MAVLKSPIPSGYDMAFPRFAFSLERLLMPLLIDGYNLLHVTGIVGRGNGPGGFERSRLALLNFLAESVDPSDRPHTTVVFDAREAPRGLPRVLRHRDMTVQFASTYDSADDLIEELILADTSPRGLLVVSSDHRIQRAARRRKATAVDSDIWYAELIRARRERIQSEVATPARPAVPLLEEDVNYWLRQFGGESALTELWLQEAKPTRDQCIHHPTTLQSADKPTAPENNMRRKSKPFSVEEKRNREKEIGPLDNPFPPGYGEDILDDLD